MKAGNRTVLFLSFIILTGFTNAQVNSLELDPVKEKMYNPYMLFRHSGSEGLADFKRDHPHDYLKELWYYSESFYVKRDYASEGIALNESLIDITRFEKSRKETEEVFILMPGYKDALVLIPVNKMIYKP